MITSNHTAGPLSVTTKFSERQFEVSSDYLSKPFDRWEDNYVSFSGFFGSYGPHLFAAAPEMLEALRTARDFIAREYRDPAQEPAGEWLATEARPAFDAICAAIAKAEGRS